MKRANSRKIMSMVIGGSIVVLIILVFGTIWTGSSVSKDTEKAVRNVSLLYLEEQAGMNAHLSKPVEPQLLFETLEKLLRD